MPDQSKHILIAEDEKPLSGALDHKLTREGYIVTIASDGEEALSMARTKQFDLILLDIIMPKMDGMKFLKELKASDSINKDTKVVVLSNLGQEEEIKKAKELGATDYLVKANSPISAIVDKTKEMMNA